MPITLRDFLKFPFNGGKGVRASQIADVDVPALSGMVVDLQNEKLPYKWRFAINKTQNFVGADFRHLLLSTYSPYRELNLPTYTDSDYFAGIAIPLDAPEGNISTRYYRRREAPLYITADDPNDPPVPHRLWISNNYLPTRSSGSQLTLVPQLRLSRYSRYIAVTETAAVPQDDDAWRLSHSPVLSVQDFDGGARHVHIALPHGGAAPTDIRIATENSPNIVAQFPAAALRQFAGESGPHQVYSSAALPAATYSERDLIVLPERAGIPYYVAPTDFTPVDVGFNWRAGLLQRSALYYDNAIWLLRLEGDRSISPPPTFWRGRRGMGQRRQMCPSRRPMTADGYLRFRPAGISRRDSVRQAGRRPHRLRTR